MIQLTHYKKLGGFFIVLFLSLLFVLYGVNIHSRTISLRIHKKVLFIIVHPDDECLFFGPSIQALVAQGFTVDLLSLTEGTIVIKHKKALAQF